MNRWEILSSQKDSMVPCSLWFKEEREARTALEELKKVTCLKFLSLFDDYTAVEHWKRDDSGEGWIHVQPTR